MKIGMPVTRHLSGEIWKLRPYRNRVLYAHYKEDTFVILHHFVKKTQKIPKKELKKAIKNLKDFKERNS